MSETKQIKPMSNDPLAAAMAENPSAVISLFKVQAVLRQRREDEGKEKATVQIKNMTRERAQSLADELCQHIQWGTETIAPAINA